MKCSKLKGHWKFNKNEKYSELNSIVKDNELKDTSEKIIHIGSR